MQNPTREQVAVALFNLLLTLLYNANTNPTGPFKIVSRRPQLWDNAPQKPALYMGNPNESYAYQNGTSTPSMINLDYDIFVYIDSGEDPNTVPDTPLNNLLDAIETAITAGASTAYVQTLGGIVNHAWIEGPVHRAPGYLNGQGMALFTIRVLVPYGG